MISIHALRKECDVAASDKTTVHMYISIHALRKECDATAELAAPLSSRISIHALRKECDAQRAYYRQRPHRFLSTHSVRSATGVE